MPVASTISAATSSTATRADDRPARRRPAVPAIRRPRRRRGSAGLPCSGLTSFGRAHAAPPGTRAAGTMIARAAMLTTRVMTKSTRPEAISAPRPVPFGLAELVRDVGGDRVAAGLDQVERDGERGRGSAPAAIVSPSARPRPSIDRGDHAGPAERNDRGADHLPLGGAQRQRGLLVRVGTCRKTSRVSAVTIGRIMIASTMPAEQDRATERAVAAEQRDPAEVVVQPHREVTDREQEESRPQRPKTTLGTAASRSMT